MFCHHISKLFLVVILIMMAFPSFSQRSISRANENLILQSAKQAVESYTRYIELIGEESDEDIVEAYYEELGKNLQSDSLYFYNDIIPPKFRASSIEENLDLVPTYLDDIRSRYNSGVKIVYNDFLSSPVYYDRSKQRLFVKITTNKFVQGKYYYKNSDEEVSFEEQIDLYLLVKFNLSGVPECKIYFTSLHQNNASEFNEVLVVEKSAPIYYSNLEQGQNYKRGTSYMLRWEGGELLERLQLSLYQNDKLVQVLDSGFVNDYSYSFRLPNNIKPGKTPYNFRLTKLASKEEPFKSESFYVKRKRPLAVTVSGTAIIAAGITYLIIKASEKKTTKGFEAFPSAPDAP